MLFSLAPEIDEGAQTPVVPFLIPDLLILWRRLLERAATNLFAML
jgi:hypothetical protein